MRISDVDNWVHIDSTYNGEQVYSYDTGGMTLITKLRSKRCKSSVDDIMQELEDELRTEVKTMARTEETLFEKELIWYSVMHTLTGNSAAQYHNYCFTVYEGYCIILDTVVCSDKALYMFKRIVAEFINAIDIASVVDESGILIGNDFSVKVRALGSLNYNYNGSDDCLLFSNDTQYASLHLCEDDDSPRAILDGMLETLSADSGCNMPVTESVSTVQNNCSCAAYNVYVDSEPAGCIAFFKKPVRGLFLHVFFYSAEQYNGSVDMDQLFSVEVVA